MDPSIAVLPMARYSIASKSLEDRPKFLMWATKVGICAEAVFITCLEQFQQAPSKAKAQTIYEWLLHQDMQKAQKCGWAAVGLQADRAQDNEKRKAALSNMREASKYYIARKTWIGKLRTQADSSLGNVPSPTMYDFILTFAVQNAESESMGSNAFSTFKFETLDVNDTPGMIGRLKAMELLEGEFRKAGFNTARMGFRLPFRFR
ncbi:hypothetical protein [Azospirillum endophyticum]